MTTKTAHRCPDAVRSLIERFGDRVSEYKDPKYNETLVRRDFIDPLFKALGWDIDNSKGLSSFEREVIHEYGLHTEQGVKTPDYGFRAYPHLKFFVEAKKPSVNLRTDHRPAYQLRRYAWNAKLPLSIVTDFEEFAVYDTRFEPSENDSPSKAQVSYIKYHEYESRWDDIAGVFSRDAVLAGSFDQFAQDKKRRGTLEVDDAFLSTIQEWRKKFAKDINFYNELSVDELNDTVQRLIDRIIFLRICEARGTEEEGRLKDAATARDIYPELLKLFRAADSRYNSGLFHFERERGRESEPDQIAPELIVSNVALKPIIKELYYPAPYDFRVFPPDVLGQVYERFLGDVISVSWNSKKVTVEPKPERRKGEGVYYTPTYIVRYIVEQTIGKLTAGQQPHETAGRSASTFKPLKNKRPLCVLDPACGSGSFLLGAYEYLLAHYLKQYSLDPERWRKGASPKLRKVGENDYRLTINERKRILLDHIYGVDIDRQAVEVTKLSLLLCCLEGEDQDTINSTLFTKTERALPDLSDNIKCGNSLIGTDIIGTRHWPALSPEEQRATNPFDISSEFATRSGQPVLGWDALIGNPPYVLLQDDYRIQPHLDYYREKYEAAGYKLDTYHLFMERAVQLTAEGGLWGFITPSNFLTNNHLSQLREVLLSGGDLSILNMKSKVFADASVDTAVTIQRRASERAASADLHLSEGELRLAQLSIQEVGTTSAERIREDKHTLFTGFGSERDAELLRRIESDCRELDEFASVNFGKQLRNRKQYTTDVITVADIDSIPDTHEPCYNGRDVEWYHLNWNGLACLTDRAAKRGGCWDDDKHLAENKLLTRQIGRHPVFAIDENGYSCLNTIFMVNVEDETDPYALMAVLNSKVMRYIWGYKYFDQRGTFPKIKGTYLKHLPIPFALAEHDELAKLAENLVTLNQALATAQLGAEKQRLRREAKAVDRQIDKLVYDLYGLSKDEIALIEAAVADEKTK
ncbi:MAG: TaqI-like C-terminal specificity domain-containing protein [Planctomycetota bacterium]